MEMFCAILLPMAVGISIAKENLKAFLLLNVALYISDMIMMNWILAFLAVFFTNYILFNLWVIEKCHNSISPIEIIKVSGWKHALFLLFFGSPWMIKELVLLEDFSEE